MKKVFISFMASVLFFTCAILPTTSYAADTSREAIISSLDGTVVVKKAGGKNQEA